MRYYEINITFQLLNSFLSATREVIYRIRKTGGLMMLQQVKTLLKLETE